MPRKQTRDLARRHRPRRQELADLGGGGSTQPIAGSCASNLEVDRGERGLPVNGVRHGPSGASVDPESSLDQAPTCGLRSFGVVVDTRVVWAARERRAVPGHAIAVGVVAAALIDMHVIDARRMAPLHGAAGHPLA